MKKKQNGRYSPRAGISKILLKMKLITLFLLIAFAASSANSYSQVTKFSLRLIDVTVKDVFQQIEENSEFILLYNEKSVDLNRKLSVRVKDETIESVLEQVCKGTGNSWKVYDRQIVVLAANETETSSGIFKDNQNLEQQPQSKGITGSIKDSKGMPLPGVTVVVKGTTTGTVSGNDGNFSIQIPLDANTLLFSFVGMKSQEIELAGKNSVNVVMEEETLGIEEVVAVGYGTMKKAVITGATAHLSGENVVRQNRTDVLNALQGHLPGVSISQNSGMPGSGYNVVIRGMGTINSYNPLYVIDGVPGGNLSTINPADIESIDVLKDAASAAIYGSRAANGVILVTTRQGGEGKTVLSYNGYVGFQNVQKNRNWPMPNSIWS